MLLVWRNHTLIEKIVCSRESKICMIHPCENFQGVKNVEQFLYDYLNPNYSNDTDDDRGDDAEKNEVEFKQWTMTDRTELTSVILPEEEFINLLIEKLNNITTHSFIAKSKASHLKQFKNTIGADEVIVLEDFAERYSFLVQDEIQGYHWNKSQCSLRPVAVYISSSDNLVEFSLCILSEDLNHDVTFVYIVIKETVVFIKKELNPTVKTIHYFSWQPNIKTVSILLAYAITLLTFQ